MEILSSKMSTAILYACMCEKEREGESRLAQVYFGESKRTVCSELVACELCMETECD